MRILITGAAGRLGSVAIPQFQKAGFDVLATDAVLPEESPSVPYEVADLCDFAACQRLTAGVDAVVHLGNIPHQLRAEPSRGYRQNTSCNFNVFQAAVDNGVRKILFASSIQVYGFDRVGPPLELRNPGYLPLDENTPALTRNWYGLSKVTGEIALEHFARETPGLEAVALRYPMLVKAEARNRQHFMEHGRVNVWRALERKEAANLLIACARASLPGYRHYLPVHPGTQLGFTPQQLIAEFFPDIPLTKPLEEITTLIDISRITLETGWYPQPLEAVLPLVDEVPASESCC